MNDLHEPHSAAPRHQPRGALGREHNLSKTGHRPSLRYAWGQGKARRIDTRQPVNPRAAAARENVHARSKGPMWSPANTSWWVMDMRLARRVVRCYFWTPSPSAHLLHPHRGGRSGPVLSSHLTNSTHRAPTTTYSGYQKQTRGWGEGGCHLLNFGLTSTAYKCDLEAGGVWGSRKEARRGRDRTDPPGQAVAVPVPGPQTRGPGPTASRPRRFLF